jgi:hypothetical protein
MFILCQHARNRRIMADVETTVSLYSYLPRLLYSYKYAYMRLQEVRRAAEMYAISSDLAQGHLSGSESFREQVR